MNLNEHRRAASGTGAGRRAVRLGLLATVSLGAIATAASAQAAAPGAFSSNAHGVAIADDAALSYANPVHRTGFDDSFTVHQYGTVFAAAVHNNAGASSSSCTTAKPCRSVALSFQIITMAGENIHLNAQNQSHAGNNHCAGCQTFAGAYQFVVSTPNPFTLSASAQRQLTEIHHKLDALGRSSASIASVQSQADTLAAQVTAILKAAAATAPKGPGVDALAAMAPTVTLHRMLTH